MAAVFGPKWNVIARGTLVLLVLGLGGLGAWAYLYMWSSYATDVGRYVTQEVPFSHKHHVRDDGLDCRYCHKTAEVSRFAGIPPTNTCMHCHWQIWTEAAVLEPVRASWRSGGPLVWNRVNRLPDYVYFAHSIHVNKGIGCETCHGRIDAMPLTTKEQTLYMKWCLDCHRNPAPNLRPRDKIYEMGWAPPQDDAERKALGEKLMQEYKIDQTRITNCTACHR